MLSLLLRLLGLTFLVVVSVHILIPSPARDERPHRHHGTGSLRIISEAANRTINPALFSFVSRPDLEPVRWQMTVYDADAVSPGLWFVAPYHNLSRESDLKWVRRPWV